MSRSRRAGCADCGHHIRVLELAAAVACLLFGAACGPQRISLPGDAGTPFPDFAQVHEQVAADCRGVRTLTAELALSGRAGTQRLRGRLHSGFEQPASMRLEAVAPFGPPGFILAARGETAVLFLPRDERVVRGQSANAILAALTGVDLAPADLQAILTGCVVPAPRATGGRMHQNGWASIDLDGGATIYLKRAASAWQLQAARRDRWEMEYLAWQGRFPQSIRLRSAPGAAGVDIGASLSQIEANVEIDPAAFTVDVPASATPLSIDDLRANGPLGER